jgi:hypothetical protein
MKKLSLSMIVLLAMLVFTSAALASSADSKNFVATLSGAEEAPIPRETLARGTAIFQLSDDGATLSYRLIVANIENVTAAHIHCGAVGVSGPVGVNLFTGGVPGSGRVDGVLASNDITAPNSPNSCGWTTLDDVVAAMLSGNAYVNVHTNDGMGDPNTGPGDFPGGEIRGQISESGPTK